jgi:hypothetical protein
MNGWPGRQPRSAIKKTTMTDPQAFLAELVDLCGATGQLFSRAGVTGSMTFYFHRSITSTDGAGYVLAGSYDAKSGRSTWSRSHG